MLEVVAGMCWEAQHDFVCRVSCIESFAWMPPGGKSKGQAGGKGG
jgi:hypothetical protein